MPEQTESEQSSKTFRQTLEINVLSPATILQVFANRMVDVDKGHIIGISSVAGDRGRGSNYHYGSSKAALSAFLDGLRHRLVQTNVHVCTVKPGFVDTPMTHGLVNPNSPLCASPDEVAKDIVAAMKSRKGMVYTKWPWRWIMTIIRHVPEFIFLKTKL